LKLLIVTPRQSRTTGNYVTANRFSSQLRARGYNVRQVETDERPDAIDAALRQQRPDAALLLHAWRSGRPWLLSTEARGIPFAVLMTGTDLNRDLTIPERAVFIEQVHQQAAAIILQNRIAFEQLQQEAPPWHKRLRLLPPGILLGKADYRLREQHHISPDLPLLLLPASIRPVKGNLELLEMVEPIIHSGSQLCLAFCGPILDQIYGAAFLKAVRSRPWAHYLGELPAAAMPAVMGQADLVLNNSFSEGVANALVEAATLGRPILARDIPGNRAVVRHQQNGLLYSDAETFLLQAQQLVTSSSLRATLSSPDTTTFSAEQEGQCLADILADL